MKRWSKLLSLILALSLVAGLVAGCGKKKEDEEKDTDTDEVSFVDLQTGFSDAKVTDNASAVQAVKDASDSLQMSGVSFDLVVTNVSEYDGETYYRMQQCYDGVPVYGKEVVLTVDSSNTPIALTSNMAQITEGGGAKDAGSVDYTKLRDKVMAILQQKDTTISDVKCVTQPETVYYTGDGTSVRPCYQDTISFKDNNNREYAFRILFDCETYEFKDIDFISTYLTTPASGADTQGEKRDFYAYKEDGAYYMYDEDRNIMVVNANRNTVGCIQCYLDDQNNQYYIIDGVLYDEDENVCQLNDDKTEVMDSSGKVIGKNLTEGFYIYGYPEDDLEVSMSATTVWNDAKAVSAMSRVKTTYDFYHDVLGRDGFNDDNAAIRVVYDDALNGYGNNAYSATLRDMTLLSFGTDIDINFDAVGHEFTHSVLGSIVDLPYRNQPGAINEAYADIFGEIIEDYSDGVLDNSCNWKTDVFRDHIDPGSLGYPASYKGDNWSLNIGLPDIFNDTPLAILNEYTDNGGVHTNSTVLSHAAYLMNTGISGDGSKAIGTELLAKIWYKAMFSIHTDETFPELAAHVYEAATRTNGLTSAQLDCVKEAFGEVGLQVG